MQESCKRNLTERHMIYLLPTTENRKLAINDTILYITHGLNPCKL